MWEEKRRKLQQQEAAPKLTKDKGDGVPAALRGGARLHAAVRYDRDQHPCMQMRTR